MLLIVVLLIAGVSLFGQLLGWQSASFDLNDPEAARAKYAEIGAIEGFSEQGQAWCSLTDREVRAIARHTEMSNIVTTTTHTSSAGEVTTSVVVEPVPNQDELVESAAKQIADGCRYNVWANLEELIAIADDEAGAEFMCQLTPEEAATLIRFLSGAFDSAGEKSTRADGESTEITVSRPAEPVDESEMAAAMEALSAECGWDGG